MAISFWCTSPTHRTHPPPPSSPASLRRSELASVKSLGLVSPWQTLMRTCAPPASTLTRRVRWDEALMRPWAQLYIMPPQKTPVSLRLVSTTFTWRASMNGWNALRRVPCAARPCAFPSCCSLYPSRSCVPLSSCLYTLSTPLHAAASNNVAHGSLVCYQHMARDWSSTHASHQHYRRLGASTSPCWQWMIDAAFTCMLLYYTATLQRRQQRCVQTTPPARTRLSSKASALR